MTDRYYPRSYVFNEAGIWVKGKPFKMGSGNVYTPVMRGDTSVPMLSRDVSRIELTACATGMEAVHRDAAFLNSLYVGLPYRMWPAERDLLTEHVTEERPVLKRRITLVRGKQ